MAQLQAVLEEAFQFIDPLGAALCQLCTGCAQPRAGQRGQEPSVLTGLLGGGPQPCQLHEQCCGHTGDLSLGLFSQPLKDGAD